MYFAVSFHFQSVVFITVLLAVVSHALPLETRASAGQLQFMNGLGCEKKTPIELRPCGCNGRLPLGTKTPLTECGTEGFLWSLTKTELGTEIGLKIVSSSYSKGIISPNPKDLGAYRRNGEPRRSGVGMWCALVYQHSSDLTHELTCYLGDR